MLKTSYEGLKAGLIGQYISDVIFNILVYETDTIFDILISISELPLYYAASIAGFMGGSISNNVDMLTNSAFRNVTFVYTNNIFSRLINVEDIVDDIDTSELIQDTIAIIILLYVFDEVSRKNFYEWKEKKKNPNIEVTSDRQLKDTVLLIFITNFYAYYKLQRDRPLLFDKSIPF